MFLFSHAVLIKRTLALRVKLRAVYLLKYKQVPAKVRIKVNFRSTKVKESPDGIGDFI